jgi:multidrug transporter EmrE-like cation transporter
MHDPFTLALALISVALTAIAQICLKEGVNDGQLQALLADRAWFVFIPNALSSPWVLAGLTGYVLSTVTWLMVLARAELSVAYPFVSLAFVATSVYGYWALHEPVGVARVCGIALIVSGVLLVARS